MTDKERAIEAAIKYLGKQYLNQLEIEDPNDIDRTLFYCSENCIENNWFIQVPESMDMVGATRYILIDKKTYKVVDDQEVGE